MAKLDPEILAHLEWIGFVRPTGLVVSALRGARITAARPLGAVPRIDNER
jgi:hypothetical protein